MKRTDNLFLLLAAIVLLASSCGGDDGVKLQGTTGNPSHTSSIGEKTSTMSYRPRPGQFIGTCFTADNSNSPTLSTSLAAERTKHVDLSA